MSDKELYIYYYCTVVEPHTAKSRDSFGFDWSVFAASQQSSTFHSIA